MDRISTIIEDVECLQNREDLSINKGAKDGN